MDSMTGNFGADQPGEIPLTPAHFDQVAQSAQPEEGGECPNCHLGKLVLPPVENCSCRNNPPCSACVDNKLKCNDCGWVEGDDITQAKADELQQKLEELKVPASAPIEEPVAVSGTATDEIPIKQRCTDWRGEPFARCPNRAKYLIRFSPDEDWSEYGWCEEHTKQFAGNGVHSKLMSVPEEAPTPAPAVAPQAWNGGEPEKVAEAAVVVPEPPPGLYQESVGAEAPPVLAPEVPVDEVVPWQEQCVRTVGQNSDCRKRATVYLDGDTNRLYCDEHSTDHHYPGRTVTRIASWLDGKPVAEVLAGEIVTHYPGGWRCVQCTTWHECGDPSVRLPDGTKICPSCNVANEVHGNTIKSVSFKPAEEGVEGLRQAIRSVITERFGYLTFVETLGVLELVKMDLAEMLKQS